MAKMKTEDGIVWGILAVWVFAFLLSAGVSVAVIWAIVRLVLHFT